MKKNIIFDFAETIAELKPSKEEILENFLASKNINYSRETLIKVYKYLDIALPYSSVRIFTTQDKKDFYLRYNSLLLNMLGLNHLSESMHEECFNFFLSVKRHWVLKDGITELLKKLNDKGYSLSIVSNFDNILNEILVSLNVRDFFENVFVSQELGLEKPDEQFYKESLMRAQYNVAESLYFGDSYLLDYLPAAKIGLDVYLLDEVDFYKQIPNRIGSIQNINQLLGLVEFNRN